MPPFEIPEELLKAIIDNRLIIFVGSGFSTDFNLPDWRSFLLSIAKTYFDSESNNEYKEFEAYLDKNKDSLDFIDTLEKFSSKKNEIKSRILNQFFLKRLAIDPILNSKHSYLFNISKKIITTNYDNSIDFLASDLGIKKIVWDSALNLEALNSDSEFYFKLHGDVEDFNSCIVFKNDYEKLYNVDHPAVFQLKKLITENVCLFIGYSFRDRDIRDAYSYVHNLFQGAEKKNYILTLNDINKDELESKYNLRSIKLSSYNETVEYIKQLGKLNSNIILNTNLAIEAYGYDCIGRIEDKEKITDFLKNPAKCFLFVYGPGGIGKTHLVFDVISKQSSLQNWKYFKITERSTVVDLIAIINKRVTNDSNVLENLIKNIEYNSSLIFIDDFYEIKEDERLATLILNLANSQKGKIVVLSRNLPKDIVINRQSHEPLKVGLLEDEVFLKVIKQAYSLRKGNYPLFQLTEELAQKICDKCQGYPLPILFIFDKLNQPELDKDKILEDIPQFSKDLNNNEIISRLISSVIAKERTKEIRLLRDLSSIIGTIPPGILFFLSSYEPSLFVSLYNKGFIWKKESYYFIHPFIKEVLVRLLGSSRIANAEMGKYYESLIQTNDLAKEQNNIRAAIFYYESSRLEAARKFKKRMYENFSQTEINALYEKVLKKRRVSKSSDSKSKQSNYAIEFAKNIINFGYSISSQQLKEAKKMLLETLNKNQYLETYLFLGNICRKLSRVISNKEELIEARKYLELSRDIAPYNIDTLTLLAIVYRDLERFEESIELSKTCLELEPNDFISYNVLGITYRKLKKIDEAIDCFESALIIEPRHIESLNELAIIYRKSKMDLIKSIYYYDRILEINPREVPAYNGKGMTYFAFGENEEAINNLKKAIEIDPKHLHSITELGKIYRLEGKFELGIDILKKGLDIDENDPPTLEQLGYTYMDMKKYPEAESYLLHQQKVSRFSRKSSFSLGLLYSKWGKYQKVIDYLDPLYQIGNLRENQVGILKEAYFKLGRQWRRK